MPNTNDIYHYCIHSVKMLLSVNSVFTRENADYTVSTLVSYVNIFFIGLNGVLLGVNSILCSEH